MDPFAAFKEQQKERWSHFAPLEPLTTPPAAELVKHARVRSGQLVLDVACGTGVVAITAARQQAHVTGLDLTPALLDRARQNAAIAAVDIDWQQGDVEALPFASTTFDVVTSQFGHIFAPRPDVAISEMLRVLRPGGTIAFSTWPPELCTGRLFALGARYMPPPPAGVAPPIEWGDPNIVRARLGDAVRHIVFARATMLTPVLSPALHRSAMERTVGPMIALVELLSRSDPARLEAFRREYDAIVTEYLEDNVLRQDFLMTRATKI